MSALYMTSQPVDLSGFRRWSATRGWSADEGRALHHLLSETYGKGVLQPFRLMIAGGARKGTLYSYTRQPESLLRETARETGTPDSLALCDPGSLACKIMPETWHEGKRLAFDLRVRPVKRLLRPLGKFSRGAELDAFLIEALHQDATAESAARLDRDQVYVQWLRQRLASAAHLETVRMVSFERTQVERDRASQGPDVTFHGELVVKDSVAFAEQLARGVGRHVAYGYGMLLLRPAIR